MCQIYCPADVFPPFCPWTKFGQKYVEKSGKMLGMDEKR